MTQPTHIQDLQANLPRLSKELQGVIQVILVQWTHCEISSHPHTNPKLISNLIGIRTINVISHLPISPARCARCAAQQYHGNPHPHPTLTFIITLYRPGFPACHRHRLLTPHVGSKPHLYLCVSLKPHQRDVARRVLCCFALRASRLNRAVEYVQVSAQRKYSQLHIRVMMVVGHF